MTRVMKTESVEVVEKTHINDNTLVVLYGNTPGVERHILISGIDSNTVIREYTKDNDLYQTANFIIGAKGLEADWDDNTKQIFNTSITLVTTTLIKIDLGEVKNVFLRAIIGASNVGNDHIDVLISDDDVTYNNILTAQGDSSGATTFTQAAISEYVSFRYLKITCYPATSGGAQEVAVYTLQIFDNSDENCKSYEYLDSQQYIDYIVKTSTEKYMIIIYTSDCYYRIVDIDRLEANYIIVESD